MSFSATPQSHYWDDPLNQAVAEPTWTQTVTTASWGWTVISGTTVISGATVTFGATAIFGPIA